MSTGKMNLPEYVLEQFREAGRVGGKRASVNMTQQAKTARAKKAVAAREAKREAERIAAGTKPRKGGKR